MRHLPVDRVMPLATRSAKRRGVHLAIVVDNKDQPPDNPGYRVKVKLPWMNEQETTFWARIVVPMGGGQRGSYFLPEKDDQLLVVFEHGDINRPLVIGAVWSHKQKPVEHNQSGKNNTKLIKSRSGHRVIFDDKQGAEQVTIVDKTKKNKIVLDSANKRVLIVSAGDIQVEAKQNVIVHSKSLKLGTKQNLSGKGQQVLSHAMSSFGVKASGQITVKAAAITINVSNAPACNVSGSGSGSLSGVEAGEQPKDQIKEK